MFDLRQFAAIAPDWYLRLHYHEELGSSNDEARVMAIAGAEHGTVVLADHQLAGRGRRGSSWVSNPGDGLLFSLVLRPELPKSDWGRIALMAGLGIATALQEKGVGQAQVKWPNDIYVRGRKCAGILVEAQDDFVVVGVGLNVMGSPDVNDAEQQTIAVNDVLPSPLSREGILAAVLKAVSQEVERCVVDFSHQLVRYREICFLTGKPVEFQVNGVCLSGEVLGIDEDGSLKVEVQGKVESFPQAARIRVVNDG